MNWTSEKPTAEGWYWRKFLYCHVEHVEVCRVQKFGEIGGELGVWERGAVKDLTGLWLGPISPTDRQQGRVACLGDVKRYVERQIKIGEDFIGGPDPNIQRRVALNEVIEYCDRQLAQAQDDQSMKGEQ